MLLSSARFHIKLTGHCVIMLVGSVFELQNLAFAGAATVTRIMKVFDPLILMMLSTLGLAVCLTAIPHIYHFWLLCIFILIPGLCAGFIDAGLQVKTYSVYLFCSSTLLSFFLFNSYELFYSFQTEYLKAIILQVWGPKKSRPLIQSFHFMYTVGAFLAPLIMNPFLEKANEAGGSTETVCPGLLE